MAIFSPSIARSWRLSRFLSGLRLGLRPNKDLSMTRRPRLHIAFPVRDLAEACASYGERLGGPEGRASGTWDFTCFGHQIGPYLTPNGVRYKAHNAMSGEEVPA